MKPRKQLATIFPLLLVLPFALATTLQIDRTTRVMADGLSESGNLLIAQIYEQMREALSRSNGDPAAALRNDGRLEAFLASTQAFGRGVVYARIQAPDGAPIAGLAPAAGPSSMGAPPFATLAARLRSRWPPDRIAALWRGRTYEMSRAVNMNGRPFAVIRIGLSTAFVAAEMRKDVRYIVAVGAFGVALSLLGAIIAARLARKPMKAMISGVDRIADGRDEVKPPVDGRGEMAALAEKFNELSRRIRQSRSQWETERGQFFEIFRSITDGVLLLDSAGSVLFANSEAQGRIGLPAGGLAEGKPLGGLIGHDSALARLIETARSSGTEVRDVAIQAGGESPNRLLVSIFALGQGPEPPGMLVVVRDLESMRELEQVLGYSDQLMRVGGLIAGVGGRIRGPLNAIAAQLEQIRQEAGRGLPVDRKVAAVRGEIERLERAVDALLSFMRPERLELAPARINPLLAETARQALRPGIRVEYRLDNGVGEIMADRGLLAEAFRNVIVNAVEAMPDGGRLTIATARQSGLAEITIADEGSGITPQNLKRVFNLFFTTKKRRNGVGLPLALRAIELHRGVMEIDSNAGAGTTVKIRLPLASQRAAPIQLRSA